MHITDEFCNSVIEEYSKRFTKDEIENGYKGMDIHTVKIVMDVIKIVLDKLADKENPN